VSGSYLLINVSIYLSFLDLQWMGTRGIGADTDFSQQDQVEAFAQGISDLTNFFVSAWA
jgi:hypothetical protein